MSTLSAFFIILVRLLPLFAKCWRERFILPKIYCMIAENITGSNGKTVVKEWLHQLLAPEGNIVRSPRSYNSQIGVPLSVWQLNENADLAIFEGGISQPGEMRALQSMIAPTIGILTGIGGAHQENFFSLQEKCMEKLSLFKDCEVIIYNGSNEMISDCMAKAVLSAREIAWSLTDRGQPLYIISIQKGENESTISYRYLGMDNVYRIPFIDEASIENSIHCLATCCYLMLPAEKITERMARLEPVALRLEVKEGKNNCILINDSYNSDLISLDISLYFLYRRSRDKPMKRTLILSDIVEMIYNGCPLSVRDHAISRADNTAFAIQSLIISLLPLYIIASQSLNRESFSIHFSCREKKFS
ncbi:UDP-N-acetylmuramoyl-tripeptide--D-alanyl-D-alanine ligase [termite gut metagenome]|uniref:UDP-N-acetylmuramoyl-tripeptide--D-alanyl-D-alanine ligase n=1 Tax=termite gut metagenome TaxID=433724 RepID=A0A5J4PVX5_9ZZZZ